MNGGNSKHSVEDATKNMPHWFTILITLIYGSGFLCVFTFSDRFGIQETGEEFFRVKYIHVGILFLLFPLTILAPLALALSLKRTEFKDNKLKDTRTEQITTKEQKPFHVPISSLVIFMNMLVVFYLFILFTPREFAFSKALVFPMIFVSSLLGPYLIDLFVESFIVQHRSRTFAAVSRWMLVAVIVGGMDYWAFEGFFLKLWTIFWGNHWYPDGGIYYLLFMVLIPYAIWRTNDRAKTAPNKRSKREMYLAALSIV